MADGYKISLDGFIDALETGKGPSARVLDRLFTSPYNMDSAFVQFVLNTPNGFTPLPDWLETALRNEGATDEEINHLNSFTEEQKILVRNAVAEAIHADPQRNVRFFWGLTESAVTEVGIDVVNQDQETRVHVRTPRSALAGAVEVGLGEGRSPRAS